MNVSVDQTACQGYAVCMMEAGAVFDLDEDAGKAVVLNPEPGEDLRPQVENAARSCPAKAIRVENG